MVYNWCWHVALSWPVKTNSGAPASFLLFNFLYRLLSWHLHLHTYFMPMRSNVHTRGHSLKCCPSGHRSYTVVITPVSNNDPSGVFSHDDDECLLVMSSSSSPEPISPQEPLECSWSAKCIVRHISGLFFLTSSAAGSRCCK
jgi:hypothetical protein